MACLKNIDSLVPSCTAEIPIEILDFLDSESVNNPEAFTKERADAAMKTNAICNTRVEELKVTESFSFFVCAANCLS